MQLFTKFVTLFPQKNRMTDRFSILPLNELLAILLKQYDQTKSMLGISEKLFFNPLQNEELQLNRFGKVLESPIGVAAGPQTQLAQNIVVSWLTGARFIELKTVQTLDELDVSKPCIDMQDEGYNCEWSQELKIRQSFDQYLNAWIIIHILRDKFGWNRPEKGGEIFNMSVGYDLKGIMKENVQWFFEKMSDASQELQEKTESIRNMYPRVVNLYIDPCISDNITLSTMHGCPADEIETIGAYLIEEKKLHTAIKLNPTLLGKDKLHEILKNSGFETQVPDMAFEHDLKYPDALKIIRNLQKKADENQLQFSIKLTNTLESKNHKTVFSAREEMMYMSGRALHPISINLAARLQNDFNGGLDISFSGGADAFNVADIVNCGLEPVTVCTDLLKPGGYGRLNQYITYLKNNRQKPGTDHREYLDKYAVQVLSDPAYKKSGFTEPSIKTQRPLHTFDCIHAPCVDTCPTHQGIPDYLYYTSQRQFEKAAEVILATNPFPHSTGMVCDHLCQTKCTRINYDSPLLIREIKRFVSENYIDRTAVLKNKTTELKPLSVSVIGAGPSGLSCAYFLVKAGFKVDVYESKSRAGGMVQGAIPSFRLTDEAIHADIDSILELGVTIHYNYEVNRQSFEKLRATSDFIYIGTGARKSKKPEIKGMENATVLDPLDFLFHVKEGQETGIGKNVVIIGGGNTAMDAARTAYRLVGKNGKVTIVYRRTIKQMPADLGEIKAVIEEGVEIIELASPVKVVTENGNLRSLICRRMKLGEKDSSGRARPVEIPGSEFEISLDTLIPAIGQEIDIDFAEPSQLETQKGTYETKIPHVYIGGDALRGASTAINAIGDGRKAAQEILEKAGINGDATHSLPRQPKEAEDLMLAKTKRIPPQQVKEIPLDDRQNFKLVATTLTEEEAVEEASRCLLCDEVCNICTTVCPNMAFHSFETEPVRYELQKVIATGNEVTVTESKTFEVKQKYQILHLADWCNECGNCDTFCPSAGAPYKEKPHLYLNKESFEKEKDGFYYEQGSTEPCLLGYQNKKQYKLTDKGEFLYFESEDFGMSFNKENMQVENVRVFSDSGFEQYLQIAAEMKVILTGAQSFYQGTKKEITTN
ncbi:MAG: putative selenate reductase subunit YgfK [Bacteroidetes bacterium]|nr:MAG: putative selenate reductase subunit YgfK [Bacteroidota bacterium]